jgi:hypothetical protein
MPAWPPVRDHRFPEESPVSRYPTYPGGTTLPSDQPPPSLRTAVNCMWAGAAISALAGIVNLALVHQALARGSSFFGMPAQTGVLSSRAYSAGIVSSMVIDIALWVWMAMANPAGHAWARITGTVFFAIATVGLLALIGPALPISKVFSFLNWCAGLAAVIYLWRPDSSAFFHRSRGLPGGYGAYPPPPGAYPPPPGAYPPPPPAPPAPPGAYPPPPGAYPPPPPAPPAPPPGWPPAGT